jgi:Rps23 Pro-64 3,4-dihydroxylase Tpa1-like proline 4-hydroxylase
LEAIVIFEKEKILNVDHIENAFTSFNDAKPFPHTVIDNFFNDEIARTFESEVPTYESDAWHHYNNQIEVKKVCNNWNIFPKLTYSVFKLLNSNWFITLLSEGTKEQSLYSDEGLNGGGWHIHSRGGKLNTHLDYSIHPKLGLERKLNIIIYLNSKWEKSWGGDLGLWAHDQENNAPGKLIKKITPKFNRAVVFDTTCNSWHGLPEPISSKNGECRKSIAVYYLKEPTKNISKRGKALFAPHGEQAEDSSVLELIKLRSNVESASKVYKDQE